ncbi:Hsp20/alpha crystallin family protein [Nocardioides sp. GY 10113]|uniref:Hsp20/alpha crystallin family protein n=1 Tax=Nocardioides sp. GY 10113 TaxID=2569761 RepID=UPI0014584747|nr:Hsp20/alpha crystallin family protein [Nocardioides sp. GY 10113]
MSTTVQRTSPSIFGELMNWMGAASEPEVRVEEYVDGDRRVIRADIPGVDPTKDIQLSVEGGVLRLHGERRAEEHDQHHSEIRYGSFDRVLPLPTGTTPQDVTAEYKHGVLTVSMPDRAPVERTTIPVTQPE